MAKSACWKKKQQRLQSQFLTGSDENTLGDIEELLKQEKGVSILERLEKKESEISPTFTPTVFGLTRDAASSKLQLHFTTVSGE